MQTVLSPLTKIWFLKQIQLFADLGVDELKAMGEITRMASVARHECIYGAGEPGEHVYLLKAGRIKISRLLPDGRELTLAILGPGEIFGEVAAMNAGTHESHAFAMDNAAICIIRGEDFAAMMAARPALSIRLTKLIGLRLRRFENRIERLLFKDVSARLADLLLELADQMGRPAGNDIELRPGLSHQEMASLIASTRETVSLTMGAFRSQGVVSFDRRSIRILDRGALEVFRAET
ncbi:MAG: Crp/Fnr family transcriptional regulator [Nitrospirae bacterium]|nr:Crp/Fnr family transcriptional regulator [Nitrospirota bacterium]